MKKIFTLILLMAIAFAGHGQDYSYTLKKTMSPDQGTTDYSFWKFPVSRFSNIGIVKGDTMDFVIAVDMAKDNPAIPSLELRFNNDSGSTDSLYISGTIKGSQFQLLTLDQTVALPLKTISSTRINMSTTDPYFYVLADSINPAGYVIPKAGVSHLRSVLYNIRLIPLGKTDTVRVTGINFKSWVNPKY